MNYFEKTGKLCRKIDIFYRQGKFWIYACSTNQHKTCRDAKQSWADIHTFGRCGHIKARFAQC